MIITRLLPLALATVALGLGEERVIVLSDDHSASTEQAAFSAQADFIIAANSLPVILPSLLLDSHDDEAIHIAAQTFANDIHRVTGARPRLYNDSLPVWGGGQAIVVATSESRLIRSLSGPRQVWKDLEGLWESYDIRIVDKVRRGIERALVITGSDRRGTIYALYTLSEQMGVSPFHYWADVPVRPHRFISFPRGKTLSHGPPTVKYRGLFINDEHPALWGWAEQKFGFKPWEPHFLPSMYEPWFEMMLRLKANYFWPAMYASSFDLDGVDTSNGLPAPSPGPNQELAQRMGIVMGTSHHEPMARNKPEWDHYGNKVWDWIKNADYLTDWWRYGAERAKGSETLFTLGMRGDGDMPLTGASNALVENITATQQGILREVYGDQYEDVGQMWCMYKEVAEYYVKGLKVPDDGAYSSTTLTVTILFADDNWGNIMSVLPPDKPHSAGGGIYYHVDYVGMPSAYKWINTISLAKTWEQMNIARAFNTTSIWIVNIGSLKPLELPAEHFLSLAWDMDAWPRNSVTRFLREWAAREFGHEHADEVADIMGHYSRYASRNKAEITNSTAWSFANYNEAERVSAEWEALVDRAGKVYHALPKDTQPAFFELVYMLCLMQANLNKLHQAVGRANLYVYQSRTAANRQSKIAIDAFEQDYNLTEAFHSLLDRKWDHMLDQAHINYHHHLEPARDSLMNLAFVNPLTPTRPGIPVPELLDAHDVYVRVSVENSHGAWPGDSIYNCRATERCGDPVLATMDPFGAKTRWIEISTGGPRDVTFTLTPNEPWLHVSQKHGKIKRDGSTDLRAHVSVDWKTAPAGAASGEVVFRGSDYSNVTITVPINNIPAPDFSGYVQGDGYVVIEAAHFARNSSTDGYAWQDMEWYGRTLSGLEMFPTTTQNFTAGEGPSVEYDFWTHGGSNTTAITVQIGPALNFIAGKQLAFGLQWDDQDVKEIQPIPTKLLGMYEEIPNTQLVAIGAVPEDWVNIVKSEIRNVTMVVTDEALTRPGKHTLKVFGMTAGIVLERIWVDLGGIAARGYSYLGPPESLKL